MNNLNQLFFELIQVAIGTRICLSHTPSADEWGELYAMAKKQSLVGVCFAGVQKLVEQQQTPGEMLYLTWMGMTAKIQQRNEVVNRQCVELQARLAADGFRSCILKGQGVGQLYDEHLRGLRQSGDIDLYVDCGRKRALKYLHRLGLKNVNWDYVHSHPKFFEDTEVELHYRVSVMRNLFTNYRLQQFFVQNQNEFFRESVDLATGNIIVPSNWMNLFYLMQHAYRHLFTEGIGLRQAMDIYFTLKTSVLNEEEREILKKATASFGLDRFITGMMWVLQRVFGIGIVGMPWGTNQREGEFLLSEIMQSGNFGKQDKRFGNTSGSKACKILAVSRRTKHIATRYTDEALATPFYYVWHFIWKRMALLTD